MAAAIAEMPAQVMALPSLAFGNEAPMMASEDAGPTRVQKNFHSP